MKPPYPPEAEAAERGAAKYSRAVVWTCVIVTLALLCMRAGFTLQNYAYVFPDSFDWITNGLRYSAAILQPFDISQRSMLLPLAAAALFDLHLEDLIPFYGTFFFLLTSLTLYFALRRFVPEGYAALTAVLFLLSFFVQAQSAYIGSDVAANFFLVAVALLYFHFLSSGKTAALVPMGALFGAGIHSQYILLIFAPAMLLSLFLVSENRELKLSLSRVPLVLKSRDLYLGILAFLASALLLLLPRLLTFHLIYTEKVQHGSLVIPHFSRFLYYFLAAPAAFSWPVTALAVLGVFVSRRRTDLHHLSSYLLVWLVDVAAFFMVLYSWKDVRFLLYVAVPVFYFASAGALWCAGLLRKILRFPSLARTVNCALLTCVLLYVMSPFTTEPWDISFPLTPWKALEWSAERGWESVQRSSKPYLWRHFKENSFERQTRGREYDSTLYSAPLLRLMGSVRQYLERNEPGLKVYYYQPVDPPTHYYLKNRNIIYLRSAVESLTNGWELLNRLKTEDAVVIATKSGWDEIERLTSGARVLSREIGSEGQYLAGIVRHEALAGQLKQLSSSLELFSEIKVQEYPAKLFNGIAQDPGDFGAAANGIPMEFIFKRPQKLSVVRLHLWSFDGRYYRYQIYYLDTGSVWREVPGYRVHDASGVEEVALPESEISGLRVVGLYNSDQEKNRLNHILHLTELEIVPRR